MMPAAKTAILTIKIIVFIINVGVVTVSIPGNTLIVSNTDPIPPSDVRNPAPPKMHKIIPIIIFSTKSPTLFLLPRIPTSGSPGLPMIRLSGLVLVLS